ncbi:30S ribosomal protein S17 [Candidatus Hodgkinia cicadicola]|nr:30S ribosomal protein S17 [Candidatus Hodgkinia cicadicola]
MLVIRRIRHSRYRKLMKRKKKFLAHDISGNHKLGELVFIKACAPYSKRKRWAIYEHHTDSARAAAKTTDNSGVSCVRCVGASWWVNKGIASESRR